MPSDKYVRTFPEGTVLFRQGDPGTVMFVIQAGKIAILRDVGDREKLLAVLPPGEFFGEMAIVNNSPRSATARVVEDAQLLVIDADTFEAMIRGSAEIAVRMIKKLAGRLAQASRQIELLMWRDPNSRVVHCLRQAAEDDGEPAPAGVALTIDNATLAEQTGLAVDEVERVVQRLERARLLSSNDDGYVIAEVGKLQDFLDFQEMRERYGEDEG